MEIKCLFCQKNYVCSYRNTKIIGPIIETECPWCNKKLGKNLSSFVETQVDDTLPILQRTVVIQNYCRSLLSDLLGRNK